MRCEDCLAVVEEYFDGELEAKQNRNVGAHLAACADCAAALDALSFEQEIYLRYERDVEVSPALWQNVRAGVARLDAAEREKIARPLPPLARLRERLAASFSSLAPRAAFAPALALLVLGVIVGALWLARTTGDRPARDEVALAPPAEVVEGGAAVAPPSAPSVPPVADRNVESNESRQPAPLSAAPRRAGPPEARFVEAGGASAATPEPRTAVAPAAPPPAPDHLLAAESALLPPLRPSSPAGEDVVAAAGVRLLDPEEKEMARHLEQAQTLLRSFQNAGASEGDAVQVAYERRLSRKLLEENATLQLGAETAGREETKQVLDSLEPFLLDIANLRDNASRDEVRSISERMRKKEIIAALQVY